jgi:hypothetical protein
MDRQHGKAPCRKRQHFLHETAKETGRGTKADSEQDDIIEAGHATRPRRTL